MDAKTFVSKLADAIGAVSDINYENGYVPDGLLFYGLNMIHNPEDGTLKVGFEDGTVAEISVEIKKGE